MTREEAIARIKYHKIVHKMNEPRAIHISEALELAIKALEQEPKTAHWIMTGDYYTGAYDCIDYVECSCCHEKSLEEGNYCPNCGARMTES